LRRVGSPSILLASWVISCEPDSTPQQSRRPRVRASTLGWKEPGPPQTLSRSLSSCHKPTESLFLSTSCTLWVRIRGDAGRPYPGFAPPLHPSSTPQRSFHILSMSLPPPLARKTRVVYTLRLPTRYVRLAGHPGSLLPDSVHSNRPRIGR